MFGERRQGLGAEDLLQRLVHALRHAFEAAADEDRGAAILVCGSLEGMSKGVHEALEKVLGAEALASLTEHGRYRRDVY